MTVLLVQVVFIFMLTSNNLDNNRSGNTMEYDTLMVSSEGKLIKHEKYYSDYVKELLREVLN